MGKGLDPIYQQMEKSTGIGLARSKMQVDWRGRVG